MAPLATGKVPRGFVIRTQSSSSVLCRLARNLAEEVLACLLTTSQTTETSFLAAAVTIQWLRLVTLPVWLGATVIRDSEINDDRLQLGGY